ncbi:hypothetical protein KIH39_23305 [Telmatocola sphagniphila]|uniref:T4 RNA ligase 1-like N-terminal domain-containing protein n=1 Tax=Telmatocola sphagniphila TaxID=1123043 RepID=A0A8E6EUR3_9BACT|nr:RNA ligase family protein [Telmatocola sphagniphila]QVL31735.1 hypothetical protein KIH39_23305 [Telmatocola sphagniphila]
MELRIDLLLNHLRSDPAKILRAIDEDPLLIRREISGLVLANASKLLFTPLEQHQLYAKGIIYQREPYRLVSLPLIKIYNLGEKEFQHRDLSELAQQSSAKIRFVEKLDGTMIQRFVHGDRVWFSTRGMLEGLDSRLGVQDEDAPEKLSQFDYLATARQLAGKYYPILLEPQFERLSLIFELIHPEARIITDYKGREDLVLLAIFDPHNHRYWPLDRVREFGHHYGLSLAPLLAPPGEGLEAQITHLMQSLQGTDQEGAVIQLENDREVLYRVKVKSPDYLKLFRLMVRCSYRATSEMLAAFDEVPSWTEFEKYLQSQGSDAVPEEFLGEYRKYYEQYVIRVNECQQIANEVLAKTLELKKGLESFSDAREKRKDFARRVATEKYKPLYFSAYDGRLTWQRVRELLD